MRKATAPVPIRTKPPPLTTTLPFPATDANQAALQTLIQDRYRSSTLNTCQCQILPLMETPRSSRLQSKTHFSPCTLSTGSEGVYHKDVEFEALKDVPVGETVIWCNRLVRAQTKNSKQRCTVNRQVLNKHAVRETHHTQSSFHQATLVLSGTEKTITDAWNRYHNVPIREQDRHRTTFIAPWGGYR